jgi:hypothetical protein
MALVRGSLDFKGKAIIEVIISVSSRYRERIGLKKFEDKTNRFGISPTFQYKGFALLDTGASLSAVDMAVPKKLGLISKGPVPMDSPLGNHNYDAFDIDLYILGKPVMLIPNKIVCSAHLKRQDIDMLIGTDIIRLGTLIFNKGTTFSFSI